MLACFVADAKIHGQGEQCSQGKAARRQFQLEHGGEQVKAGQGFKIGNGGFHDPVHRIGRDGGPAECCLVDGVVDNPGGAIDAQGFEMQPENGGLHHLVQLLVLHGLPQSDTAERQKRGQGEATEYLLIQIAGDKQRVLLLPLEQRVSGRIADEKGEGNAGNENQDEGYPGEKARQSEGQAFMIGRG